MGEKYSLLRFALELFHFCFKNVLFSPRKFHVAELSRIPLEEILIIRKDYRFCRLKSFQFYILLSLCLFRLTI